MEKSLNFTSSKIVETLVLRKIVPSVYVRLMQDFGHSFSQYGPPGQQITILFIIFFIFTETHLQIGTKVIMSVLISYCNR